MQLTPVFVIEEGQIEHLYAILLLTNCRLVINVFLSLPLGICVSNKKGAFNKMNHKNAKTNCQIIHFHEKSVFPFCCRAAQACAETMAP